MKHILTMLTALAAVSISCTQEIRNEAEDMSAGTQTLMTKLVGGQEGKSVEGSLLFKVDDALLKRIEAGEDMSGTLLNGIPVKSFTYALPAQPKNVEAARKYGLHKWFRVCFDENMPVHKAAEIIAAAPEVKAVQFDSYLEPVSADAVMPFSATAVTKSGETAEAVFDDIYLSHQWNLINEGKAGAVAGADVGVKDAWRLCAGDPRIVVAVFDEGVRTEQAEQMTTETDISTTSTDSISWDATS